MIGVSCTSLKSNTTLRSHLVQPKDPVDSQKRDGVEYKIPCAFGKVYIGETGRCMHEWIKEHDGDTQFHKLKLRPFLNTLIRPGIIPSGMKLS